MTPRGSHIAVGPSGGSEPAPGTLRGHFDPNAVLLEIANLLATKLDPDLLFETVAEVLRRFFRIDRASLALYDQERDAFDVIALALHEGSRLGKGHSVPRVGSRAGKVFDSRQPFHSLLGNSAFVEDIPLLREGMHTSLSLPMIVEGRPIGTFNIDTRRDAPIGEFDVGLLTKVANQIGIAVANSRAFQTMRRTTEALRQENANLLRLTHPPDGFANLLLNCPSLRGELDRLRTIAETDATVLVTGETGTGKGVLARTLHAWSARRDRPFVKCDCAALTPTLVESELFGHERGAFTGAQARRIGRFELAHRGTLFLDEVAEIPPETQAKLLGVLEDRQLHRVGGTETVAVDIRIIAATNRDLRAEVAAGRFRADLFYRLNVLNVHLRPLRDRPEDIVPLAQHFVHACNRTLRRRVTALGPAALGALTSYPWPGNIRELQHVIERAMLLNDGPTLSIGRDVLGADGGRAVDAASGTPGRVPVAGGEVAEALRAMLLHDDRTAAILRDLLGTVGDPAREAPGGMTLAEVEARHVRRVLAATRWRVSGPRGAAAVLGIPPSTLRSLMQRLGIRREPVGHDGDFARARPRDPAPARPR